MIAGGIALGILMNEKLVHPSWLIDISGVEALHGIELLENGALRIGALGAVRGIGADRGSPLFGRLQAPRGVGDPTAHRGAGVRARRATDGSIQPMNIDISLQVNGTTHQLSVEPTETLINVLRNRLKLTGTNKDCAMGICGVCTVLLNCRPVSSCILLAVQADGDAVTTVEALEREGALSMLQEAFLKYGAVQLRILHAGVLDHRDRLARREPVGHSGRDHRCPERKPLPMHRLQENHRGRGINSQEIGKKPRHCSMISKK